MKGNENNASLPPGQELDTTRPLQGTAAIPVRSDAPAQPAGIVAGTRIAQYEIIRELGRGGMGAVYLARDTKLGRRVAIKFLYNKKKHNWNERFMAEAQVTARCVHENIVVIHEVKQYEDTPFMVLEYLSGQPLSSVLTGMPLPVEHAIELMVPVVRALVCAHAQGIVHRDLKPENIIITDAGTIKVVDFGIAKLLSDGDGASKEPIRLGDKPSLSTTDLTERTSQVGTVPFMSPEQWGADEVDHRTDIWAVGIILYIMITGRHPLSPLRAERLASTATLETPMPSVADAGVSVPDELARIIDHCLIKPKAERMGSAKELLAALEPFLPGRHARRGDDDGNPYAGLAAFQEADADRFFGRTRDIAAMAGRLREQPLIGVVGPSGVGKSSFIRAGVIPALKRSGEAWETVIIRPGRHPLAALAHALVPLITLSDASVAEQDVAHDALIGRLREEPGYLGAILRNRARSRKQKLVLFVDQFEELYTLVGDVEERAAFIACLLGMADDAAAPLRAILSIRSDFLDRAAEDRDFMSELTRGLCFLPSPDRAGLREALVKPAELVGYHFSSEEMVEHMLDALDDTPGALPLLQFTAGILWDARDTKRRLLTGHSYARIGGVAGALAGHADAVLRGLPTSRQRLARSLFRRLVTPERTRDLVELDELRTLSPEPGEIEEVVRYFVDARLLVIHQGDEIDSPLVEIVHESLITRWPALRRWLDENEEAAAFLADLRAAARQWRMRDRSPGLLWRGDAVDNARRWHEQCAAEMSETEREYVRAVFALADRSARIKRRLIAGTMAFLLALVAAAAIALIAIRDAEQTARQEAERAREAERVAQEQNEQIRDNERRIREQLEQLQAERRAARAARQKAREASDLTALTKRELITALGVAQEAKTQADEARDVAERQARRARRAHEQARQAAAAEKQARERLQRLLRERERRIKKLEKEIGGVADGPLR